MEGNRDSLIIDSSAFSHSGNIPPRYTCDGKNISPPLAFYGIPEGTTSLVLIMDDIDAVAGVWDHWIVFNIPPSTNVIEEGREPSGVAGARTDGEKGYYGPCPSDGKEHRYVFRVYALDTRLDLPEGATKNEVLSSLEGHCIAQATLMGKFRRGI